MCNLNTPQLANNNNTTINTWQDQFKNGNDQLIPAVVERWSNYCGDAKCQQMFFQTAIKNVLSVLCVTQRHLIKAVDMQLISERTIKNKPMSNRQEVKR